MAIPNIPDWNEIIGAVRKFLRGTSGEIIQYDANGYPQKIALNAALLTAPDTEMLWRATGAITINKIYAIREGGTGALVNALRNGTDDLLAADLAVGTTWTDGGALQNNTFVAGDTLEAVLVSVTGAVTNVTLQFDP